MNLPRDPGRNCGGYRDVVGGKRVFEEMKTDHAMRQFGTNLAIHSRSLAGPLREQHNINDHPSPFFRGVLFGTALAIPLWAALSLIAWWVLR